MIFKISADNFILEISKWWWRAIGWRVVIRPMSKYYSLSNDCTYMSTRVWPPRTSRATQPTKTLYSKRCTRLTSFFRILMEKNRLKWHELNHFLGIIFFFHQPVQQLGIIRLLLLRGYLLFWEIKHFFSWTDSHAGDVVDCYSSPYSSLYYIYMKCWH